MMLDLLQSERTSANSNCLSAVTPTPLIPVKREAAMSASEAKADYPAEARGPSANDRSRRRCQAMRCNAQILLPSRSRRYAM